LTVERKLVYVAAPVKRRPLKAVFALVPLLCLAPPAPAQVHPGGRWWTLETEHFRVHVRAQHRELGLLAAAEAEAAFALLLRELPPPYLPVELVVSDDLDEANGFATIFPTPRLVVFAPPPAADPLLATYDRWLRLVITHELAHLFHLDLTRGWWAVARSLLGRVPGLFPNTYAPTWLIEGLAVFFESRLTAAGRLEGSFHRAVVGAAAAEGRDVPIDAAGALSPRWPHGIRPYAFGGSFVGALAAEHGDSVPRRLVQEMARRPLPYLQLNGALRAVTGRRFTDAWRRWQDSLGRLAPAEPGAQPAPPASAALTGLRVAVPPRVSPDGRSILLAHADGRDVERLARLDRETGAVESLARLNLASGVAWDGEGGAVVAQLDFTDPYTIRSDLWRVAPDGSERRLTRSGRLREPTVGPDGTIYAVRLVPGGNELVRLLGDSLSPVAPASPGVEWAQPVARPAGTGAFLLAATRVTSGRHDVVLLSPDGAVVRALSDDWAIDRSPAFSLDGRRLFWSREVDGVPQVVSAPLEGDGELRVLTREPFGAYAPAPAGDSLFYLAYHADGWRLAAVATGEGEALPPSVAPPPDQALPPPVAIRSEHPYRPFPTLWPKFWIPIVQQQSEATGWYGAFTAGTDALQRHAYLVDASVGTGEAFGEARAHLLYLYAGLTPLLLDLAYSRDASVFPTSDTSRPFDCCAITEEADLGITARHQRWRWGLASRLGGEYERSGGLESWGPVLSAAYASAVQPAVAISPQRGVRLSLTLRRRWVESMERYYQEAVARGSTYLSLDLGAFSRHVVALRASAGSLWERGVRARYGVGGLSSSSFEVVPGLSFGGGSRTFPVRGHEPATLVARRAATMSVELRSPLALVGRGLGLWPVVLDRLSMALFADAARAWDTGFCPPETRGWCGKAISSAGLELVTDVGVAWDFPLRLRGGAALNDRGRLSAYFAVGPSF
jgi:hypothetical protein